MKKVSGKNNLMPNCSPNIITIIPARGGSVGIPEKNIIDFGGKPLLAWSIDQAKESQMVGNVYVSTDDPKIANISRQYGAEVIDRPSALSTAKSVTDDALIHALDFLEKEKDFKADIVVFLQVTSPIRRHDDIDNAIKLFIKEQADSLFSCANANDHFIWSKKDGEYFSITYDFHDRKMRQDINDLYLENGSIYIFRPELLRKEHNRLGGKISIYEMPKECSWQIDEPIDLAVMEALLREQHLE